MELTNALYGKCPFCLQSDLNVADLVFNTKIRSIIQWFERQRAYRAEIDYPILETELQQLEETEMKLQINQIMQEWQEEIEQKEK